MTKVNIVRFLVLLFFSSSLLAAQPSTVNNNDSCDIALLPAATLLLPYFEVDTAAPQGTGTTTLFTITNTSHYPQIAHVTLWTDFSFPVLAFDIFLTGYDVQGINLYDVIQRGVIVSTSVASLPGRPQPSQFGTATAPLSNTSNPNFVTSGALDVKSTCANLPGVLVPEIQAAVKNALTSGVAGTRGTCGLSQIGLNHGLSARGYVTVDVVSYCSAKFPTDADGSYFTGPAAPILFDNVLTGDYQQIGPSPAGAASGPTFDAEGGPLVHIRAVPEGGLSGAGGGQPVGTNLPFTFYDRYTPLGTRAADRRQPLPSAWSARFIQGGSSSFATDFKVWREGLTAGLPDCTGVNGATHNLYVAIADLIRFDEHENSYGLAMPNCVATCAPNIPILPSTSRMASSSSLYPVLAGVDVGGWMYLNLSSGALDALTGICRASLSAQRTGFGSCSNVPVGSSGSRTTSQNWVISSMFGGAGSNRLSVDFDAIALGNGCSPATPSGAIIAPLSHPAGSLVCPPNAAPGNCSPATRPASINP